MPPGPPPKELVVKDLKEGSGATVRAGDHVKLLYTAIHYDTGKNFASNWYRATPFKFTFGSGETIDGWEEGLKGMRVGGRRELILPPELAYNVDTLIYVIDLLEARPAGR